MSGTVPVSSLINISLSWKTVRCPASYRGSLNKWTPSLMNACILESERVPPKLSKQLQIQLTSGDQRYGDIIAYIQQKVPRWVGRVHLKTEHCWRVVRVKPWGHLGPTVTFCQTSWRGAITCCEQWWLDQAPTGIRMTAKGFQCVVTCFKGSDICH